MQTKSEIVTRRSWSKYLAYVLLRVSGWRTFYRALSSKYKSDNKLPRFIDYEDDKDDKEPSLDDCFVNLALVEEVKHKLEEKKFILGTIDPTIDPTIAAVASLNRGDLYQKLLNEGKTLSVSQLFSQEDLTQRKDTGWAFIIGRAGTGKTTLLQYISYRWAIKESLWHNRFEFVFRVKLNLVGQNNFLAGFEGKSSEYRLAALIHASLGHDPALSLENICLCLRDYRSQILLLLDGFDEIEGFYGPGNQALTAIIDAALAFPNGILTTRPSDDNILNKLRKKVKDSGKKLQEFENLGLTKDNVRAYIRKYFIKINVPNLGETLVQQLDSNPLMMGLAQIPVNIAAICFVWKKQQIPINTMTELYQKVIIYLAKRYCANYKPINKQPDAREVPGSNDAEKIHTHEVMSSNYAASMLDKEVMRHCHKEFLTIESLAYEAFAKQNIQYLDNELLNKYFADNQKDLSIITSRFGILRKSAIELNLGESFAKYYFIHLTYQEYFAARYIARQLSLEKGGDVTKEIERVQNIRKLVDIIRKERANPRYFIVWRFLAGLVSTSEFHGAADYFWDAVLDEAVHGAVNNSHIIDSSGNSANVGSLVQNDNAKIDDSVGSVAVKDRLSFEPGASERVIIGLHPQIASLQKNQDIVREALLMPKIADLQLPNRLCAVKEQMVNIAQWRQTCQAKDLLALWDEWEVLTKTTLQERQDYLQAQQQYAYDSRILEFAVLDKLHVQSLLAFFLPSRQELVAAEIAVLNSSGSKSLSKRLTAAIMTLVTLGARDEATLSALRAALQDENEDVRRAAAKALGTLGAPDEATLSALRAALQDKNEYVRIAAAKALGALGALDEALSALRAALQDKNEYVRIAAAEALGALGALDEALSALRAALQDKNEYVRIAAAEALGALGARDEVTLSALRAALQDEDKYVRIFVAEALGALGARDEATLSALRAALQDEDEDVRLAAAEALGALGAHDEATLSALRAALQDNNNYLRRAAAEALGALGARDEATLSALRAALQDKNEYVRIAAAKALGALGARDEATLSALRAALQDKNEYVRIAAAKALGALGARDEATLSALRAALQDKNEYVRIAAAKAFKHIAPVVDDEPTITALLDNAHKNTDADITATISLALLRISPRAYGRLPCLLMSSDSAQRFFVAATWLHGSSVSIDQQNGQIKVDGEITASLPGSPEEWQSLTTILQDIQSQFITATGLSSSELAKILKSLEQPLRLPAAKPLPDVTDAREDIVTGILDIYKKLNDIGNRVTTLGNTMNNIGNTVNGMANKMTNLEYLMNIIMAMLGQNATKNDIEALQASLKFIMENNPQDNSPINEKYSQEQNIYMHQFKVGLMQMHHTAFVTAKGAIKVEESISAQAVTNVLDITSHIFFGIGTVPTIFSKLISCVDKKITIARMERISSLGLPAEVDKLSDELSKRLFNCRNYDNVGESVLSELLSDSAEITNAYASSGYYGALFFAMDKITKEVNTYIAHSSKPDIKQRAEQDCQYFIAAIGKRGLPLKGLKVDYNNQLFLLAAPLPAIAHAIFLLLLQKFCDAKRLQRDNINFSPWKRNIFSCQMLSLWHENTDDAAACIESSSKCGVMITDIADKLSAMRHNSGIGFFYTKASKSMVGSLKNLATRDNTHLSIFDKEVEANLPTVVKASLAAAQQHGGL